MLPLICAGGCNCRVGVAGNWKPVGEAAVLLLFTRGVDLRRLVGLPAPTSEVKELTRLWAARTAGLGEVAGCASAILRFRNGACGGAGVSIECMTGV